MNKKNYLMTAKNTKEFMIKPLNLSIDEKKDSDIAITFIDALKILKIEDYVDAIFNSNSRGELFHLQQYFILAEAFKENNWDANEFRKFFELVVEFANKNWDRPQSVYQHILKFYNETVENNNKNK